MRRKINNVISVLFSFIRFAFIKLFHWSSFHFELVERFSPNVVVEIRKGGYLSIGKKVRVHSGTKIKASKGGKCSIGDGVKINYNCMIICHDNISIGNGVEFGPSVYLYDHDHYFNRESGVVSDQFRTAPVIIGEHTWIGANTVILRGTKLGKNCVVGAGSILNGEYPDGSVIVQKRETVVK